MKDTSCMLGGVHSRTHEANFMNKTSIDKVCGIR